MAGLSTRVCMKLKENGHTQKTRIEHVTLQMYLVYNFTAK